MSWRSRGRRFEIGSATTRVWTPSTSVEVFWPSKPNTVSPSRRCNVQPSGNSGVSTGTKPAGGRGWLIRASWTSGRYRSTGVSAAFHPGQTGFSGVAMTR